MKQLAAIILMVSSLVIAQGCMSAKLPGGVQLHGDSQSVGKVLNSKSEGMAGGVTNIYDAAAEAARHGRKVHITDNAIDIEGAPPEPHRGLFINKSKIDLRVQVKDSQGQEIALFDILAGQKYELYLVPGKYTITATPKSGSNKTPCVFSFVVDNVKGDAPYGKIVYDFWKEIETAS